MPRGDGTGPMGMGPKTGRGMGSCTGFAAPGNVNGGFFGMGRGHGRGNRKFFCQPGSPTDEKTFLHNQESFLERQLSQVREQLKSLKETE